MTGQPQEAPVQLLSFEARAAQAQRDVMRELKAAEKRIGLIYLALNAEKDDGRRPDTRRLYAILESLRTLQKLYPPITPSRKG